MNIYIVTDHFFPDIGGLEQSTKYLSEELNKECNVEVLTVESKITYKDNFSFPVTRFSTVNGAPYLEMYDYIAHRHKDKVQAICFFGFSPTWTDEHLEFVSMAKSKLAHLVTFKIPSLKEFSQFVNNSERKQKFDKIDFIFCLNEGIFQELITSGISSKKIICQQNCIPSTHFTPPNSAEKLEIRNKLEIENETVLIFTGRFAERKRVNLLVDVFEQIPEATLVLVGFFDNRFDAGSSFTVQPDSKIKVFEPTFNILPFLQASDWYITASVAEGMPNALLEALSCGLPAIATSIPGHAEIIRHGYNGLLFLPDNVDDLIRQVKSALKSSHEQKLLSQNARNTILDKYDISYLAKVYKHLIFSKNDR
ncbi:MAG: glycosyltransferase family 4 protein [Calothrix sp. MO_192.B10]|nr:glycosyltransferase family 4 protein [Calothrix sp. MO_192.B10]